MKTAGNTIISSVLPRSAREVVVFVDFKTQKTARAHQT
jgi:hypothetical protein